jgi:peptide/nickel transport system permease protein
MARFIRKRVFTGFLTVLFCLVLNFALVRLAPGNPIQILAGTDNPNPEMIAALEERYGLNKSIPEQFMMYLQNLSQGNFGFSYLSGRPVMDMIAEKVVPSLLLTLTASIFSVITGTLLGLHAARNNGKPFDKFMCSISYFFDAIPSFWLGIMNILVFASLLKWFPTNGMINVRAGYTGFKRSLDIAYHLVLPVFTLVAVQSPFYFRIARASVIQILAEDFITTFRAVGMSEGQIFTNYVLKNAIIPTVTVFGMSLAYMITGAALLETVFSWPGLGRLLLNAIYSRDYPILTAIYLVLSISVALFMILIDLVYGWIDPRIRFD